VTFKRGSHRAFSSVIIACHLVVHN
jgi:hypothetical protein